jgi:hypothetical protein
MPDQPSPKIELLRAAYAAFNARDIDTALTLMTADVAWPRAFKGGFVRGPEEVRAYWTEQWSEINPHVEPVAFHPEGDGHILVEVHQVVRDLAGSVLADERVGHRFTLDQNLIQSMEVFPPPSPSHDDLPRSAADLAVLGLAEEENPVLLPAPLVDPDAAQVEAAPIE